MNDRKLSSEKIDELAAALLSCQQHMAPLKATKKADIPTKTGGRVKYSYTTLADVTRALHPMLAAAGLSYVQRFECAADGHIVLVTHLMHGKSEQWIMSCLPINVTSADFRVLGSAITYARRYSLCALCGLAVVGEDDDGGATHETQDKTLEGIDPDEPLADYPAECAYIKAVAVELYGEKDAESVLQSLAVRRFRIVEGDWRLLPRIRLQYAIEALKKKAAAPDRQ